MDINAPEREWAIEYGDGEIFLVEPSTHEDAVAVLEQAKQFDAVDFGTARVVTRDNVEEPWVIFELPALSDYFDLDDRRDDNGV